MWQLPTSSLVIEPGQTHLWRALCVPATIDLGWHREWLTTKEMARAERFATETLRRRFLQAHSLLHTLLSAYTQAGPQRCELAYHATGKPYLRVPQLDPTLEFNMSHAGEMVVIALARGHAVGVDVELKRPLDDLDGLIGASCTAREAATLAVLAPNARLAFFYWLWTRKEAWLKLLGVGLGGDLTSVEVHETPTSVRLLDIPLAEIGAGEYIGAVALPKQDASPAMKLWDARWV
jgi:4'-phosphopantetheinyl transferase